MKKSGKVLSFIAAAILGSSSVLAADEIIEPTGLDQIIEIIKAEPTKKFQRNVSAEAIAEAEASIESMNALIREAVVVNGLANDGVISISDAREINRYLVNHYGNTWYELRGQRASGDGYWSVEKQGALTKALNVNAVNTTWAQIYNLGFVPYNNSLLSNSSGGIGGRITDTGYYLGEILNNEVIAGTLDNPDFKEVEGTTGTGLDRIVGIILNDAGLLKKIATGDMRKGAAAADAMNHLIIEAILAEGLGNDGTLTTADIRQINHYLVANHRELWAELHGDDEEGYETGYHLVQNDGAYARMFADNVVNSVADGVYHLGFETDDKYRLLNEDGNKNKQFEKVAWWLDACLREDLEAGRLNNPGYKEVVGTTGTTFDEIVPLIYNDEGLLLNVSMEDIRTGARSANGMNELIVEAMRATGVAADGHVSIDDVKALNVYLVTHYAGVWAVLHGDDETDAETGYHCIQNDGARGEAYNRNIMNKLADGVYHLGFATSYTNYLVNEDGNRNVSFRSVAYWMNKALQADLAHGNF